MLADMYRAKFIQAGFEAEVMTNVSDALKFLQAKRPDAVLLDIVLGEESGLTFLEKRRDIPGGDIIPVVAFSNYDEPKTRNKAIELGAEEYLLKTGYTPQAIVEKVKGYLSHPF